MAVDYTKIFTVAGKYVDKVKDYYLYIGTHNTDQAAIEATLAAQTLVRLGDGLDEMYDDFRQSVSDWIGELNSRVESLFTDEILIGNEFAFGSAPSIQQVWPVLIRDMLLTDKNVTASVSTIGAPSYSVANATSGKVATGSLLDGYSPAMAGAAVIPWYAGLGPAYLGTTTQLTPDSETLTLTCLQDSETGTQLGGEQFLVSGTGKQTGPYSPEGESIGDLGILQVADSQAGIYIPNYSFDSWEGSPESPTGWTVESGTAGTDFEKEVTNVLLAGGTALKTKGTGAFKISQNLSNSIFNRRRAYFISVWARKATDASTDDIVLVRMRHGGGGLHTVQAQPTGVAYQHFFGQFIVPAEITDSMEIEVECNMASTDPVIIDQIVIAPCQYFAGVALGIFQGASKFLAGDKATIALSNDNAGLFQNYFRKAFKVQLPTDATPTISDALVA